MITFPTFHFTDEETNFYYFDFLLVPTKLPNYLHAIACKIIYYSLK